MKNMSLTKAAERGIISGNLDLIAMLAESPASDQHAIPDTLFTRGSGVFYTDRLAFAGERSDSYLFFGYVTEDGSLRILAGCRDFSPGEAINHWDPTGHDGRSLDRREWVQSAIGRLEEWKDKTFFPDGTRRMVAAVAVPPAPPPGLNKKHVQDFMGERLWGMFKNWSNYERGTIVND